MAELGELVLTASVQSWTRLIRFVAAETSQVHIGEPIDRKLDGASKTCIVSSTITYSCGAVGLAFAKRQPIKAYEIAGSALDPAAQVTKNILTVKELLAPLSREQLGIVRCLGLNYSDHAVRQRCIFVKILLTR